MLLTSCPFKGDLNWLQEQYLVEGYYAHRGGSTAHKPMREKAWERSGHQRLAYIEHKEKNPNG